MNKPKFLHVMGRRLSRCIEQKRSDKAERKRRKFQQSDKGRIFELEQTVKRQNEELQTNSAFIEALKSERRKQEIKLHQLELERTDPFKADKWKVIYQPNGKISTVYLNDQELFGIQRFDIDFDSSFEGQTPRFTLEGYGSIDVITESE